jgi:hypothetical protein
MTFLRTLRTAARIPPRQLAARAQVMLRRRLYAAWPERPIEAARRAAAGAVPADSLPRLPLPLVAPEGIDAVRARAEAFAAGRFRYLNSEADYRSGIRWRDPERMPLWRYQLQYLGSVLDCALAGNRDAAGAILASWRAEFGARWDKEAWHPYPASLRLSNLCHAAAALGSFDALGPGTAEVVATHAAYVRAHLEHDVGGNHLLENLRALSCAGAFLRGAPPAEGRDCGFAAALAAQLLEDGGHYELSPMYHGIVLWRTLEVPALTGETALGVLPDPVTRMRAFLAGILCPDGEIPLLGDSARNFAPPAAALLGDVRRPDRLGVACFPDAGLHVFHGDGVWAILDAGPVCPDALPAHGQADSLTVEVWCGGRRIVGDPGVAEYTGPERAWGRSSRAHSTVTVDDRDTSEAYGSFRVGGRATIDRVMTRRERDEVTAVMTPWGVDARFTRIVRLEDQRRAFRIVDDGLVPLRSTGRSRLHLAPGVRVVEVGDGATSLVVTDDIVRVRITAVNPVRLEPGRSSPEFGLVLPTTIVVQDLRRESADRRDVHGGWLLERA